MITTQFDGLIHAAAMRYMPLIDWLWFKAQWYCESALKPDAVSPAGALGLCQIMPDTFAEIAAELEFDAKASPLDPVYATLAGAYYMRKMWNGWKAPRSTDERLKLAQASYNAGMGSLLRAQVVAGMASDYDSIVAKLPRVTGVSNAVQTTSYVREIAKTYAELKAA